MNRITAILPKYNVNDLEMHPCPMKIAFFFSLYFAVHAVFGLHSLDLMLQHGKLAGVLVIVLSHPTKDSPCSFAKSCPCNLLTSVWNSILLYLT